jgi:hypothetical protein
MIIAALIGCGFIWPGWSTGYGVAAVLVFIVGATITIINYAENESSMDWM